MKTALVWLVLPSLAACAALMPSPDCMDNTLRNQMVMTFKQKEVCKWT